MKTNYWIQKTKMKKGALSKQLGVPMKENIPKDVLKRVVEADIGKKVTVPKGKVTVTRLMKRRAVMASTLKRFK
jgi:hypothetical protein